MRYPHNMHLPNTKGVLNELKIVFKYLYVHMKQEGRSSKSLPMLPRCKKDELKTLIVK